MQLRSKLKKALEQRPVIYIDLESTVQKTQQTRLNKQLDNVTDVMDLLGGLDIGGSAAPTPVVSKSNAMDLLGDLLGTTSTSIPTYPNQTPRSNDPFQDLLGLSQLSPQQSPTRPPQAEIYSGNGLKISLEAKRDSQTTVLVKVSYQSLNKVVTNISLQVAVPKVNFVNKSLKLAMQPATSNQVLPNLPATQLLKIENPNKASIKIRCKLSFVVDGRTVNEMVDFDRFDSSLWA